MSDEADDGRETLGEAITDALGECLMKALDRHPANPEKVRAAFRDLKSMSHAKLFELVGPGSHESGVNAWLQRPALVARQHGRLFWSPDLLEQDMESERAGRHLPRATDAPRLFLAYSWSHDDDTIFWIEEFASWLYGRGYDIVFDRDPRHIDKGFSSNDVLALLASCSQLIVVVTDGYQDRICDPKRTSPACQEFALAPKLYQQYKQPTLLGVWIQGEKLRLPFSPKWVVDYRDDAVYRAKRDAAFPIRMYNVVCVGPDRTTRESGPMERVNVRPTVHKFLTERPGNAVAVRDVTNAVKRSRG